MPVLKQLHNQLNEAAILRTITGSLFEISAIRIASLQREYEQNSLFFEEITQLYYAVKQTENFRANKKLEKKITRTLNPKTIHIALTSNNRFYGVINQKILSEFLEGSKSRGEDRIVVGRTGKDYLQSTPISPSHEVVIFSKDLPKQTEVQLFLEKLLSYQRIFVYYPKFVTMLSQHATRLDITHSPVLTVPQERTIEYIFEPELVKIIDFFENQVRFILFSRVLLESELARTAARLITMDSAEREAHSRMKKTIITISKTKREVINRQLIETATRIKQLRRQHYAIL